MRWTQNNANKIAKCVDTYKIYMNMDMALAMLEWVSEHCYENEEEKMFM